MRYANVLLAVVASFTVLPLDMARAAATPASPAHTDLNDDFSQLRDDFNRAKGSVRLLFVVDPICPACLRGMDDMNRDLLSRTQDDRLRTFVVHLDALGGQAKDIAPAARLLENPHVRNYWNASGDFGYALSKAVQLKPDKDNELVYAWDVWLLYGPDAEWVQPNNPPRPQLLMHQLWKLDGSKFPGLDSKVFAGQTQALLAKVPAAKMSAQ